MLFEPDGRRLPVMVFIPARGGSKGVPKKALADLGGKPLLAHSIDYAKDVKGVDKVVVSTDDCEIQQTALDWGAEAPFLRPSEIAQDDSPLEQVFEHALSWYQEECSFVPRVIVQLMCTSPFRRKGLVDAAVRWGLEDYKLIRVTSVVLVDINVCQVFDETKMTPLNNGAEELAVNSNIYGIHGSFSVIFPGRDHCDRAGNMARFLRIGGVVLNEIESLDIDTISDLEEAKEIVRNENHIMPGVQWRSPDLVFTPECYAPYEYYKFAADWKTPVDRA